MSLINKKRNLPNGSKNYYYKEKDVRDAVLKFKNCWTNTKDSRSISKMMVEIFGDFENEK